MLTKSFKIILAITIFMLVLTCSVVAANADAVPVILPKDEIRIYSTILNRDLEKGWPWELSMVSEDVSSGILVSDGLGYRMDKTYEMKSPLNPGAKNVRFIRADGKICKLTVMAAYPPSSVTEYDTPETGYSYSYTCWIEPTSETECQYEMAPEKIEEEPEPAPVVKKNNPIKIEGRTFKVKYKYLKKKTCYVVAPNAMKFVNWGKGKKRYYKKSGNKKVSIRENTGKIKIKKGLKKGTYTLKFKIKALGNEKYKAKTIIVTSKLKVV